MTQSTSEAPQLRHVTLAERFLRRCVPRQIVARAILGDLLEDSATRFRRGSPFRPVWVWWNLLRIGIGYRGGRHGNELGPQPNRPEDERSWLARVGDELRQDARLAVRAAWRQPRFTLIVVVTLALGIGANATMFGVVSRLLLQAPPHLVEAAELVRLNLHVADGQGREFELGTASYPVLTDLRTAAAFDGIAGVRRSEVVLGEGASARQVLAGQVTGNYFEVLGTAPAHGRMLSEADDLPPAGQGVVVLSYSLWRTDFGGEDALGRELSIDGTPFTIIGVAPPGFTGDTIAPVSLWVPYSTAMATEDPGWPQDRFRLAVGVVARLPAARDPDEIQSAAGLAYGRRSAVLLALAHRLRRRGRARSGAVYRWDTVHDHWRRASWIHR